MTKFLMMVAAAAMALFVAPSSASANQCIPENGNGRLICPFVHIPTWNSKLIIGETITTTVKKPKIWWPKGDSFKPKFGKFGGPKFGGPKFGGLKFGGPKFGGPKFGGFKFGGSKFGGSKFGGSKFGGSKFGKYGGYKHGKHVKTTTQTKYHEAGGRKGPGPLASYALGATWCSAGSLVLNALIVNANENRELTRSEAWQTTAGCWVPILGPLLVDAYFKANPQWAP
jgi:hypothetical protein